MQHLFRVLILVWAFPRTSISNQLPTRTLVSVSPTSRLRFGTNVRDSRTIMPPDAVCCYSSSATSHGEEQWLSSLLSSSRCYLPMNSKSECLSSQSCLCHIHPSMVIALSVLQAFWPNCHPPFSPPSPTRKSPLISTSSRASSPIQRLWSRLVFPPCRHPSDTMHHRLLLT